LGKVFFQEYYSIKSKFTLTEISKLVNRDETLNQKTKSEINEFINNVSDLYFGTQEESKESIRKANLKLRKIVNSLIQTKVQRKKKPKISKTKKILKGIALSAYEKDMRPFMEQIHKAEEALGKEDLEGAQKRYEKINTRYLISPGKLQKKIFPKLQELEKEIQERYYITKNKEIERMADHAYRNLKNKEPGNAEHWYKKAMAEYDELPKNEKKKYFHMLKDLFKKIEKVNIIVSISSIHSTLKEVSDMKKKYSFKYIHKRYRKAEECFGMLDQKEKEKLFPSMKKIRLINDAVHIVYLCENIAKSTEAYWKTSKLFEKRLLRDYEKVQDIYVSLPDHKKQENFETVQKAFNLLTDAVTDFRIKKVSDSLATKRSKTRILEDYKEIIHIYEQLPEGKKQKYYENIQMIFQALDPGL